MLNYILSESPSGALWLIVINQDGSVSVNPSAGIEGEDQTPLYVQADNGSFYQVQPQDDRTLALIPQASSPYFGSVYTTDSPLELMCADGNTRYFGIDADGDYYTNTILIEPSGPVNVGYVRHMDMSYNVRNAIIEFLKGLTFTRYTVSTNKPLTFQFSSVNWEWPTPNKELVFPAVTVLDPINEDYAAHSLTPTVLEDTYDPNTGFVMVKDGEYIAELPVTIWAEDRYQRAAIIEGLEIAMNPDIFRMGIFLPMPMGYGRLARFTMIGFKKLDTAETTFKGRLQTLFRIRVEADYVRRIQIPILKPQLIDQIGGVALPPIDLSKTILTQ